jgi:hypothetical protein
MSGGTNEQAVKSNLLRGPRMSLKSGIELLAVRADAPACWKNPYSVLLSNKQSVRKFVHCIFFLNLFFPKWIVLGSFCCIAYRYIQITWYLSSLTRSGRCLANVGTARQCYTCSKNIYSVGSTSTLSIAMKSLMLRLNFVCPVRRPPGRKFWHSLSLQCLNETAESC